MSPQQKDARVLDDSDVGSDATNSIEAPYSFGDRDDIEYLDQTFKFFEGLFDSTDPEIGHLFDAFDDTSDVSKSMQVESFPSDLSYADENNPFSVAFGPVPVTNDNMIRNSLATSQHSTNPLSANVPNVFVSPSDLTLNITRQLESMFVDTVALVHSVPNGHSGPAYPPGTQWPAVGVTDQAVVSQDMQIDSFEALLMETDFADTFVTSYQSFPQGLDYQQSQYSASFIVPPITTQTESTPRLTALDGSELRQLLITSVERSSQPPPRKKRKRTIKGPVKANNAFGRGGTWACRLCRDRRWKCVYSSFGEACQLCRGRNVPDTCVKITAAEYDPSRVLRGGNGTCKDDTEQMLLHYIYSDTFAEESVAWSTIFRSLAAVFGNVPRDSVLLHSILALSNLLYPKDSLGELRYHSNLALRGLKCRSKVPGAFGDAGLFGAAMVVFVGGLLGETIDYRVGLCALFAFSSQTLELSVSTSPIGIFSLLGPTFLRMNRDALSHYSGKLWLDYSLMSLDERIPSWTERRRSELEYCRITGNQYDLTKSTLFMIKDLLQTAWTCLYGQVTKSSKLERTESVCHRIEQALNDPDFQEAWELLNSPQRRLQLSISDAESIQFSILGKLAVDCVVTILQASNTTDGLAIVEKSLLPSDLLRSCAKWSCLIARDGFLTAYIYRVAIVLGGCTISRVDLSTCQAVILECLRVRTRERLGNVLSEFWSDRSMENLGRVMEETQTRLRSERRWYEEMAMERKKSDSEADLKD